MEIVHETLHFTRELARPIATVWGAYADIERRVQWSVPIGDELVYDASDFSEGGVDSYRCGPPGDLSVVGQNRYQLIDPRRRLVYTDAVEHDGQIMAVALLTWKFEAIANGTRLTIVDQITSFVGRGMVEGHRNGHELTLDQLVAWLAR